MSTLLDSMGFPPPEARDSIRFYFLKSLPYNKRIFLALGLIVLGMVLQAAFLLFFPGAPFLVLAVALVLVGGYDSRVRLKGFSADPRWSEVPVATLEELEALRKRTRDWDRDLVDISNPLGCFGLFLAAAGIVLVGVVFGAVTGSLRVAEIVILDAGILLFPLWVTGMRFILTQPNLAVKNNLVLKLYQDFQTVRQEGETFKPALMLARNADGKTVPTDARFSVAAASMPAGLYGLQAQINLNIVQGRSYPYFYCVIAARPGYGLGAFQGHVRETDKILCEVQQDAQAEVLVIRQRTTKRSGYHTRDRDCSAIFRTSLDAFRGILQAAGPAPAPQA